MSDAKLEYLIAHGAQGNPHSDADLLSHLVGTRDLLAGWGARPALCDAALFHSIYGTESFAATLPLLQRDKVSEIIGAEAESLAYLFSAMVKPTFLANLHRPPGERLYLHDRFARKWVFLEPQQFSDLCNLFAANWLEQSPRFPQEIQNAETENLNKMLQWLLTGAQLAAAAPLVSASSCLTKIALH